MNFIEFFNAPCCCRRLTTDIQTACRYELKARTSSMSAEYLCEYECQPTECAMYDVVGCTAYYVQTTYLP